MLPPSLKFQYASLPMTDFFNLPNLRDNRRFGKGDKGKRAGENERKGEGERDAIVRVREVH